MNLLYRTLYLLVTQHVTGSYDSITYHTHHDSGLDLELHDTNRTGLRSVDEFYRFIETREHSDNGVDESSEG